VRSAAEDILPLRRGYYVSVDVPCGRASNATLNLFDGAKLGQAHAEIRKTTVGRKRDGSYEVTEEWLGLQGGERAKPQVHQFNLLVLSPTEFVIKGSPRDYKARYLSTVGTSRPLVLHRPPRSWHQLKSDT